MSSQPSCQSCWQPPLRGLVLPFLGFVLGVGGGCRKEEITVYHVPKEPPADVPAGHAEVAGPELRWQAPDHWQQLPAGGMRLANFLVPDAGGRTGQVSIVTLPTAMGQQVQVLNIFREPLQVPPLADADLPALARQVPFGPGPGQLFDMLGESRRCTDQHRPGGSRPRTRSGRTARRTAPWRTV